MDWNRVSEMNNIGAAEIVQELQLEPHVIEGGYFRVLYRSPKETTREGEGGNTVSRVLMSSIYYALTAESSVNYLHKNHSTILHYFLRGSPIKYVVITPDGQYTTTVLGPGLQAGHKLHLNVPGGYWKTAKLLYGSDSDYGLISEVVCPGFDYEDETIAKLEDLKTVLPHDWKKFEDCIK